MEREDAGMVATVTMLWGALIAATVLLLAVDFSRAALVGWQVEHTADVAAAAAAGSTDEYASSTGIELAIDGGAAEVIATHSVQAAGHGDVDYELLDAGCVGIVPGRAPSGGPRCVGGFEISVARDVDSLFLPGVTWTIDRSAVGVPRGAVND